MTTDKYNELRAELNRYCLANYENGFDVAIETFNEEDWAYIIGKSKGSFAKAVDALKYEIAPYLEQREEIEATAF